MDVTLSLCKDVACAEQYLSHCSISFRLRSNKSVRLYAATVLLVTECASAISTTSAGKLVRSAAQSRNVDRKPCVVRSLRPMRRSSIRKAILERGLPCLLPGKTKASLSATRWNDRFSPSIASERGDKGT